MLRPIWDIYFQTTSPRALESSWKPRVLSDYKEMEFSTQQGSCTYGHTAVVTACTTLVPDQARQYSSMERGIRQELLPIAEKG